MSTARPLKLTIELNNKKVRDLTLTKASIKIGRQKGMDIVLDQAEGVSRHHATISETQGGWQIEDCHSTNGTQVNGRDITVSPLLTGARVQIGEYIIKVTIEEGSRPFHEKDVTQTSTEAIAPEPTLAPTLNSPVDKNKSPKIPPIPPSPSGISPLSNPFDSPGLGSPNLGGPSLSAALKLQDIGGILLLKMKINENGKLTEVREFKNGEVVRFTVGKIFGLSLPLFSRTFEVGRFKDGFFKLYVPKGTRATMTLLDQRTVEASGKVILQKGQNLLIKIGRNTKVLFYFKNASGDF